MNNVHKLEVTPKSKLKTMSYKDMGWVYQDYLEGYFRPGIVKMNVEAGDRILLVGRTENGSVLDLELNGIGADYAIGMVGVATGDSRVVSLPQGDVTVYEVDWIAPPVKVDPTYRAVQGGYIKLEDRADLLAQIACS